MKAEGKKRPLLAAKINYYKDSTGYSKEQLSQMLGISTRTWDRYMNEPGLFKTEHLINLSRLFNTTELIDSLISMAGGKLRRPESNT